MQPAAGALNQRVTIMRPQRTQDASGQVVDGSPVSVGSRWASVEPVTGREADLAERLTAETTHRVTFRSNRALTIQKTDYLVWRTRRFEIEAVSDFPPEGYLIVMAKETK
jgi:head-tail adaptor